VISPSFAEQHEVFAEQPDALAPSLAVELGQRRDGLPVAPHQFAAGRAAPDAGEHLVLLGGEHVFAPSGPGIACDGSPGLWQ
jgi:hypothetical protein